MYGVKKVRKIPCANQVTYLYDDPFKKMFYVKNDSLIIINNLAIRSSLKAKSIRLFTFQNI